MPDVALPDIDWKKPDHDAIFTERMRRLSQIRNTPGMLAGLKAFYKDNPAQFICDWGITFDPRNAEIGLPVKMAFILFPRQIEAIDWLVAKWRGREDGLVEKSRDMGLSWLCVSFAVWMWLYHPESVIGFGSRKEEYVDRIGDPKALFWKARAFIDGLPVEFQPAGWDSTKHAPFMRILNPENGSAIVGEAGDNIGRGNRTGVYFKDEAQPLTALVLTPSGWKTMGDMHPGAVIAGPDGGWRCVTHINDAGVHPVYRIGFSDGTFAECSHNHLWVVDKVHGKRERLTLRAHEIAEKFKYEAPCGQVQYRFRVPVARPVKFADADPLPIDPYVLGAMLGDGGMSQIDHCPKFTTADPEIAAEVERLLPDGVQLVAEKKYGYRFVSSRGRGLKSGNGKNGTPNRMRELLRDVGLLGHRSPDKWIPEQYLLASPEDRLSLLQGLMDTDGSASGGVASFHTSSLRLALDMLFLVQALGGTATHNVKPDARGYLDMHVLHLTLTEGMKAFRLERKLKALRRRKHPPGRTINSISLIGEVQVRCITVDAPDGLYLTDNCIVTHNSAFYERPEAIDAALSQTSNCKIDVSTPNGVGNPFYRKRHGGKISVFVFDWRDDPRKDEAWYQHQCETLEPHVVAQEIDRNYSASVTNTYISADIANEALRRGPANVPAVGGLRVGVDPARFGDDKFAVAIRRGRLLIAQHETGKVDSIQGAAYVRALLLPFDEAPEQIAVDEIGIGAGVVDQLGVLYPGGIVVGVNSSLRMDGEETKRKRIDTTVELCYNLRAQMWREMKEWLAGASIPNDPELVSELASVRYTYRGGSLLLESKDDMKRRGVKSPNKADSLAMTFAVPGTMKTAVLNHPFFQNYNPAAHAPATTAGY